MMGTPKSSISIGGSIIHKPFGGTPISWNLHRNHAFPSASILLFGSATIHDNEALACLTRPKM